MAPVGREGALCSVCGPRADLRRCVCKGSAAAWPRERRLRGRRAIGVFGSERVGGERAVLPACLQIQSGDTTDIGTIATVVGGLVGVAILGYLGLSVSWVQESVCVCVCVCVQEREREMLGWAGLGWAGLVWALGEDVAGAGPGRKRAARHRRLPVVSLLLRWCTCLLLLLTRSCRFPAPTGAALSAAHGSAALSAARGTALAARAAAPGQHLSLSSILSCSRRDTPQHFGFMFSLFFKFCAPQLANILITLQCQDSQLWCARTEARCGAAFFCHTGCPPAWAVVTPVLQLSA